MKKKLTPISIKQFAAGFTLLSASLLFSCKSEPVAEVNVGSLSVYNFSPTYNTYDAYINDTKLNTAALPFGGGVKYSRFAVGDYAIDFKTAGTTESVLNIPNLAIERNVGHTLYLTGGASNLDKVYTTDNYPNAEMNKSYIRFINLSPDAGALELVMNDTSIVAGKAYKTYSEFTPVNPSTKVFVIKDASNEKAKLEDVKLNRGYFYTIVSRGKVTPANDLERAFGAQVILHQ